MTTAYNPTEVDRLLSAARDAGECDLVERAPGLYGCDVRRLVDAMADQLEAARAEIERLTAENTRLRKIARDVRDDEIHSFCID